MREKRRPDSHQNIFHLLSRISHLSLLVILLLHLTNGVIYAHHEHLAAPEREYLKTIALHPFKDEFISSGDYGFYITVSQPSPESNYVDLLFYVEHLLIKRPLRSPKEILITSDRGVAEEKFTLETDITGLSAVRYVFREPFPANIKVSTQTPDNRSISVETEVNIGSPESSLSFPAIFLILILIAVIISLYPPNRTQIFADKRR